MTTVANPALLESPAAPSARLPGSALAPVWAAALWLIAEVLHFNLRLPFGLGACVWAAWAMRRPDLRPYFKFTTLDLCMMAVAALGVVLRHTSLIPANSAAYAERVCALLVFYLFVRLAVRSLQQARALVVSLGAFTLVLAATLVTLTSLTYWSLARLDVGNLVNFRDQVACLRTATPAAWITVLLALLPFPALLCAWKTPRSAAGLLGCAALALDLAAIGLSFSRGVYMGAAAFAGISIAAIWLCDREAGRLYLRRLAIPAALALLLLAPFWKPVLTTASLFSSESQTRSTAGRVTVWKQAAPMIAAHWLAGAGPGNFPIEYLSYREAGTPAVFTAFNLPLEILVEQGILGLACYTALLAALGWRAFRAARSARDFILPVVLGAAVTGLLVRDFTYSSLLAPHVAVVLSLIAALLASPLEEANA